MTSVERQLAISSFPTNVGQKCLRILACLLSDPTSRQKGLNNIMLLTLLGKESGEWRTTGTHSFITIIPTKEVSFPNSETRAKPLAQKAGTKLKQWFLDSICFQRYPGHSTSLLERDEQVCMDKQGKEKLAQASLLQSHNQASNYDAITVRTRKG